MPSLISDFVGWRGLDAIATLFRDAMVVLVPTPPLYDIYTYTEDVDVETAILGAAKTTDEDMDAGTTLSTIWEDLIDAFITHISAAGVSGGGFDDLDAYQGINLTTGRHYRMSRYFANVLRILDGATALDAAGVSPLETTLRTMTYGGTSAAGTALDLALEGPARTVAEITGSIGATNWNIDVVCIDSGPASPLATAMDASTQTIEVDDATDFPATGTVQVDDELITITNTGRSGTVICTDATRAIGGTDAAAHAVDSVVRRSVTRTVLLSLGSAVGDQTEILMAPIVGTSRSGQATVAVTNPEAAGFAAGQQVLLEDDTYPRKLTTDLAYIDGYQLYGNQIVVEDTWPYSIGDQIVIHDDTLGDSATYTVYNIDRPAGVITVSAYIAQGFTTAQKAHIRLLTAEGLGRGSNEVGVIDSVDDDADTITLDANLRNTYYISGNIYLLIAKVVGISTSSGGQAADAVSIIAQPDRLIYK